MQIKQLEKTDVKELWDIWEKFYSGQFPFPDITQPIYAIQRIIRSEDGEIVLAAIVKMTAEGIFITNKDLSPLTRMKAIKLANEAIKPQVFDFGFEDIHTFAENDDHYVNILRKLGWIDCSGYAMVKLK